MIAKHKKRLRKVCSIYEQVENYYKAIADKEQVWHLHHRREIDEMKSAKQLKDEGKYYNVTPEELIFLTVKEHNKIHSENLREETRKKMSEASKLENLSEETRKKMSENHNGGVRQHSSESRKKISENRKGKCLKGNNSMFNIAKENHPCFEMKWFNNGIEEVFAREAPQNFIEGRLKRYWYNNGVVQVFCTTPPECFVKGRLKKS